MLFIISLKYLPLHQREKMLSWLWINYHLHGALMLLLIFHTVTIWSSLIHLLKWRTLEEILSTKGKSAVGPDLVNNFILKLLPDSALSFLTNCFNKVIEDGSFPAVWNRFATVFIPKPGAKQGVRPPWHLVY